MVNQIRPRVVVSKCLEFAACRYDGQVIRAAFVKRLEQHVDYTPVCPEMEIGLGVPRFPIRVISKDDRIRLVQPATGRDTTADMNRFSQDFLSSLQPIYGFILKSRSPSCGTKDVRIYPKAGESASIGKGPGMFGGAVLTRFPTLAVEDEGRLRNLKIREHFLTKLFAFARFRTVKESNNLREMVRFQTENKLMLMAYNQKEMRILGNIVANRDGKSLEEVTVNYEIVLGKCMAAPPGRTANINVFLHVMSYFSDELSKNERGFFLDTLNLYRKGRVPLTSVLGLAKPWVARFQNEYLAHQSFFDPYPIHLMEWTDASRPIEL